ncbi:aminotransferase class I/II-fold pyridoxal phosphate-dependent enzyme [Ereboglobus luteus]|uniref:8-amino-7-oxononanoate synthase n=1 Tax=Ereboglobus luteus TaxID=1796921 RepID=A0A2U8E0N5_9BACT|nr:pyridoxal phosphate-dependent aminotransferase family protein [Ereboglobus luteus]AWI08399.1 8-amino-7-oxononanoate synthase [Ereboglobus luteus]
MPFPFFQKSKKPILARCHDDQVTKMRLKYNPYYHAMQSQRGTEITIDGRPAIMLASNDYLGLSFHPKVIEAACAATRKWGTSSTGARISNGSRAYHLELEEKLAAFLGREACHVHAAGYLSCVSAVACFAQKGDIILADKNNHSSLWDGTRLSHAQVERFSHNNTADLADLAESLPPATPKMFVAEGVYSMEGHIAALPALLDVADRYNTFNVIDDAHGFGVLGRQGRGTVDHFGLNDRVDVLCGSLSKSLSSTGGFIVGSRAVIEYLRTHSKQTIFSAALSPGQTAAAQAALEVLQTEPQHHERLWQNTRRYRDMLHSLKLDTWGSEAPAIPVVLGSKERVYRFWQALLEKGVFTVMSIAPAVPPGKDLIRTAISAQHTDEQLERIADAMAYAVKKL